MRASLALPANRFSHKTKCSPLKPFTMLVRQMNIISRHSRLGYAMRFAMHSAIKCVLAQLTNWCVSIMPTGNRLADVSSANTGLFNTGFIKSIM